MLIIKYKVGTIRFPNLDSSISTTVPGPSIFSEFLNTAPIATSRQKFDQSTRVLEKINNLF